VDAAGAQPARGRHQRGPAGQQRGVAGDVLAKRRRRAARAVRAHPGGARSIDAITALYIDLRYGPAPEHGGVSRLRALVREFRI